MATIRVLPVRLYQAGVLVSALLLGVLAAADPKLAVAAAGGMIVVALVFTDLAIGFAVFTFVAFLEALPAFGRVSFPKAVGLLLLLSWIGTLAVKRHQQDGSLPPVLLACLLLLPAWAAASGLWALDQASVRDS